MLVYEKWTEEDNELVRHLYGTENNVPSELDKKLVYLDEQGNILTPTLEDKYLDDGEGGITMVDPNGDETFLGVNIEKADGTLISVVPGGSYVPAVKTLKSIEFITNPTKVDYEEGEVIDITGAVIEATWENGSKSIVDLSDCVFTPAGELTTSDTVITAFYTYPTTGESQVTKSATCPITVVSASTTWLEFFADNYFSLETSDQEASWDGTMFYSLDSVHWNEWDGTQIQTELSIDDNKYHLYLRGINNTVVTHYIESEWTNNSFKFKDNNGYNAIIACVGNIEALLDYEEVDAGNHPPMGESCFNSLFEYVALTSAPTLPATALNDYCYTRMFVGCGFLTTAPELPATTMADYCYFGMFSSCTRLVSAPALPATTLAEGCYQAMFNSCTAITTAPELPAIELEPGCYDGMFADCTSLTTAPALPGISLADYCYYAMFRGCVTMSSIPELPATVLCSQCYQDMFNGCSALKLSETETEDYTQEYRIPAYDAGQIFGEQSLDGMFNQTGGTFTGTPTINTVYYLHKDNSIIPANQL